MSFARPRRCLPVDGVLLLDKPVGFSSNQALQQAKRLLHACKAGHTGSLDPIATGLLPLCFGEATKVSQYLIDAGKRYWALFELGVATTTYDREGEVTARRDVTVSAREVAAALRQFEGEIEQVPPMYSAIKRDGQALYELARRGVEVEREPRRVSIDSIRLVSFAGPRLEVEIACSKGTYIHSLAHDLGTVLGCGAHVAELRRLAVGALRVADAVTLEALAALATPEARAGKLLPVDAGLSGVPEVQLTALAAHYLRQGQPVTARHGLAAGTVRLYDEARRFLGMGEILDDGQVAPRRLLSQERAVGG